MQQAFNIAVFDIGILVVYLVLSRVIPLWLTRKQTRDSGGAQAVRAPQRELQNIMRKHR